MISGIDCTVVKWWRYRNKLLIFIIQPIWAHLTNWLWKVFSMHFFNSLRKCIEEVILRDLSITIFLIRDIYHNLFWQSGWLHLSISSGFSGMAKDISHGKYLQYDICITLCNSWVQFIKTPITFNKYEWIWIETLCIHITSINFNFTGSNISSDILSLITNLTTNFTYK